jgi:hypothetical protein
MKCNEETKGRGEDLRDAGAIWKEKRNIQNVRRESDVNS